MRVILSTIVTAGLLAASQAQAPTSQWVKQDDKSGGYVAFFPSKPVPIEKVTKKDGNLLKFKGYVSAQMDGAQLVMYVDVPQEAKGNPKQILAAMIAYVKAGDEYKITREVDFTMGDLPAKRIWIEVGQGAEMINNVFISKGKLYQVAVVGPPGSLETEQTNQFFTSFRLK